MGIDQGQSKHCFQTEPKPKVTKAETKEQVLMFKRAASHIGNSEVLYYRGAAAGKFY